MQHHDGVGGSAFAALRPHRRDRSGAGRGAEPAASLCQGPDGRDPDARQRHRSPGPDTRLDAAAVGDPAGLPVQSALRLRVRSLPGRAAGTDPARLPVRGLPSLRHRRDGNRGMTSAPFIDVRNLRRVFDVSKPWLNRVIEGGHLEFLKAVDGVTFDIPKGKTVGVVGESGCGKSVTALSLMQLVQRPQGQTVEGEIRFNGKDMVYDIVKTPTDKMEEIRGAQISMIFQEPMTSLNPVFRAGHQIDEVIELHNPEMTKEEVKKLSLKMIEMVGIANQEGVYMMYPHELSGGMRQRIMIAMALACNPSLIIADEPTTALDVTIQAQILDLLRTLKDKINSSIMLITHDLGVVAEMADYVVVMYAGRIIEKGTADEVFNHPSHPYTVGLMASKPVINKEVDRLYNIPGNVPNPINMPNYCYFRDRCAKRMPICDGAYPREFYRSETHMAACYLYADEEEKA